MTDSLGVVNNPSQPTVDASDRKLFSLSGAVERFEEAYAAQQAKMYPVLSASTASELEILRADVVESIEPLQAQVNSYDLLLSVSGDGYDRRPNYPPGYLEALSELSERNEVLATIDALLDRNERVLQIDAELAALDERETALQADVSERAPPRDYSQSPPSSGEALNDNHREAGLAELDNIDDRREQLQNERSQLIENAELEASISIAHGNSLLRIDELRNSADTDGDPLNPNNTLPLGADDALEIVLAPEQQAIINQYAEQYDIPPTLLAGVVAAELDFDGGEFHDVVQDTFTDGLGGDFPDLSLGWDDALGPAQAHQSAIEFGQQYLSQHDLPGAETANAYPLSKLSLSRFF